MFLEKIIVVDPCDRIEEDAVKVEDFKKMINEMDPIDGKEINAAFSTESYQ